MKAVWLDNGAYAHVLYLSIGNKVRGLLWNGRRPDEILLTPEDVLRYLQNYAEQPAELCLRRLEGCMHMLQSARRP